MNLKIIVSSRSWRAIDFEELKILIEGKFDFF